ncbi:MAG TPA: hypothetical protein VIZ44_04235 [Gaiellaceae bacterium]
MAHRSDGGLRRSFPRGVARAGETDGDTGDDDEQQGTDEHRPADPPSPPRHLRRMLRLGLRRAGSSL